MTRDDVIGVGLGALALLPVTVGLLVGSAVLAIVGGLVAVLVLPAAYKLVRYDDERESLPGEIVTDMRRVTRGPLSGGMLVSLSGIDGSGKSTLGDEVVEDLRDRGVAATRVWGRWEPRLSYPVMGLLYVTRRWRRKDYHRSRLLRRWWGYLVLADQLLFSVLRVYPRLARGEVVVVDRWVADQLVELRYDGLENRQVSHLLERWLPSPSVGFYLDVPVEVALERKTDTQAMLERLRVDADAETYLHDRRDLFEGTVDELGLSRVDTTDPLEESVDSVVERVLDVFYGLD